MKGILHANQIWRASPKHHETWQIWHLQTATWETCIWNSIVSTTCASITLPSCLVCVDCTPGKWPLLLDNLFQNLACLQGNITEVPSETTPNNPTHTQTDEESLTPDPNELPSAIKHSVFHLFANRTPHIKHIMVNPEILQCNLENVCRWTLISFHGFVISYRMPQSLTGSPSLQ